jgi:hypothetical protein
MKKTIFFLLFNCMVFISNAQNINEHYIALPITNYILKQNDSVTIVQVELPENSAIKIDNKALGMLVRKYDNATNSLDTSVVGYGRCNLIKGRFYYFGISTKTKKEVKFGDLIQLKASINITHLGVLAKLSLKNIQFTDVEGNAFYTLEAPFGFSDNDEGDFIAKMANDIKYTGAEMLKAQPNNNLKIDEGRYKGGKLLEKMKMIEASDVLLFLEYVNARPSKYKGNTWKISETFATWMHGGAPEVIK